MDYEGASFIVTGASLGVGRALALELAARGATLVLSARTPEPLAQAAQDCSAAGEAAGHSTAHAALAGSCASSSVARALVCEARELGDFQGFFHCAGVLHPGPLVWELDPGRFAEVFEAGPMAAHQLAHAAYPALLERGAGLAVFFGSGAATIAQPGIGAYCAAKAAQEHLTRQLAAESPEITAFNYRPGIVDTRMQTQARQSQGGGAAALHAVFQPWKDHGDLISPETSALVLLALLDSGPERFHGGTASWSQGAARED